MSRTNYGDPVAHYIRGVYDEYMSKWSHGRERVTDEQKVEQLSEVKGLSIPATVGIERQKGTSQSAQRRDDSTTQQQLEVSVTVVKEVTQLPSHDQTSISNHDESTIVVHRPTERRSGTSEDPDIGMLQDSAKTARSTESPLSSIDDRRFAPPRTDRRCETCWRDSIPCQHSQASTFSRIDYLRRQQNNTQRHKKTRSHGQVAILQDSSAQQAEQQQRDRRQRDRQEKEREAEKANDESVKRKDRPKKRHKARIEAELPTPSLESESEEEIVQWSSRRQAPSPIITKPLKYLRMGSEEIAALTSTPTLTPANLRRNTAVPRPPVTDIEAEERARIQRKEEREATERAIAEQQAAEMRAKEANIRKCYYCWHYSQPCNLKMKPKCIPCHKNRRSCFGGYTRPEFCDAYKERTGKVHKQAEKDVVKPRQQMKRKGHYNGGRKVSANPQPQRFFLNDNKLKCYRCWDRNLSCDLDTPKCASCVKGRAACFGFKSSRQEFCEMFEEETGEKHRWAAFFESGGVQTTPPPSATTPSRRRARKSVREDETSESEDAWNSQSDESNDDHDDDIDDSDDD